MSTDRLGYVELYDVATFITTRVVATDGRVLTPEDFARVPASERAYVLHLPERGPVPVGVSDDEPTR